MQSTNDSWRPASTAIDVDHRQEILQRNRIVVIHFWAIWDPYDRQMDSVIQEVRLPYERRIAFFSHNVDPETNWSFAIECGIKSVPALICFIDTKKVETIVGLITK